MIRTRQSQPLHIHEPYRERDESHETFDLTSNARSIGMIRNGLPLYQNIRSG